jgi:hypothetical protein
MTYTTDPEVHDTAIKVGVYSDEFLPLLKVINCAILMPEKFALTEVEHDKIVAFQDAFADLALEYGV